MRKLTYYIALTIDGFIADPDGGFDFYSLSEDLLQFLTEEYPETLPTHVRRAMGVDEAPNRRFDTVVMGRGTYAPPWTWISPAPTATYGSTYSRAASSRVRIRPCGSSRASRWLPYGS